jgi:CubicO group peptidase (beta-lactamase class C family)
MPRTRRADIAATIDFVALSQLVAATRERIPVPGVSLGLIAGGEEQVAGLGVTSIENPLDVDPDTLFQIGSITKTFTGTVAMHLVEAGKLDLDLPVRSYLSDLRLADEGVASAVTMRHLLTHTAGWTGDYFDDLGSGEDALERMVARLPELPQLTPVGEVWSYNNAGFYLAGRVLEVVAGKPYEQLVHELVLEPLELTNSFFFAEDVLTRRFAVGHLVEEEVVSVARPWSIGRAAHPAGGLVSTVRDLLRYGRFHLGDEPAWVPLMQQPQVDIGGAHEAMGIAWILEREAGVRTVLHGGGTNGQVSALALIPDADLAFVVLTNSSRGGELIEEVWKETLRQLGLEESEPEPLELPRERLQEYVGSYTTPMADIDLRLEDGGLVEHVMLKGGFPRKDSPPGPPIPPVPLVFYAEDRVFVPGGRFKGHRAEFLRDPEGQIVWYRDGGRIARRQEA